MELNDILIVKLYEAIEKSDPKIISKDLTMEEFEILTDEYVLLQKKTLSVREKRKQAIDLRIQITVACLTYLEQIPDDEDIYGVLRDNKWVISADHFAKNIDAIIKGVKSLVAKSSAMARELDALKPKGSKMNVYDILATMGLGLEGIYLDPRKVTVIEFVSYQAVLERKASSMEKVKK